MQCLVDAPVGVACWIAVSYATIHSSDQLLSSVVWLVFLKDS